MIPDYRRATNCFYCERLFNENRKDSRKTKDHIIPKDLGGINNVKNYIAACAECNRLKSNRNLPDFSRWLLAASKQKYSGYVTFSLFRKMSRNSWKLYNKTNKMHRFYLT